MRRSALFVTLGLCLSIWSTEAVGTEQQGLEKFEKVIFGTWTEDLVEFDSFVHHAKKLGATHIDVAINLPLAMWQFDTPGDPYPAWMVRQVGILKICPPNELKPYIPADYSAAVMEVLEGRCKVLRRNGLKGYYYNNEPQVLPEAVFRDHPLWRGPRVDQGNRSRVARFAPCMDNAEVLELYRKATEEWIRRCPEIDIINYLTTDSGSGLCWSPGLYQGPNGSTLCKDRPMADRIIGFMNALCQGAETGGGSLEQLMRPIGVCEWMVPSIDYPEGIVRQLNKGMSIKNMEGPRATDFMVSAGVHWEWNFFYPVVGIPQPVSFVRQLSAANQSKAPRLNIKIEPYSKELFQRTFELFWQNPPVNAIQQLQLLKKLASEDVGVKNSDKVLSLWLAIDEANKSVGPLRLHHPFMGGVIHQRWITRPLVPFPEELTVQEKAHYSKYIFQALDEAHANNLIDLQATQVYGGWSGKFFVSEILLQFEAYLNQARQWLAELRGEFKESVKDRYELMDLRLQALICLSKTCRNMASYQAQLDRVRQLNIKPYDHPVLGTQSNWDRQLMINTARSEIDNMAVLIKILESNSGAILDLAPTKEQESIRILGPDIIDQLHRKINIMNAHWEDYKLIFNTPNP